MWVQLPPPAPLFFDALLLIEPEAAEKHRSNLPVELKPISGIADGATQTTTGLRGQPTLCLIFL